MRRVKSANYVNPWMWVPSLFYAEGLPFIITMSLSVVMYKRLGISNADITLYTSWLYIPWALKPFWSPLMELYKPQRFWIISMELILGGTLACVALSLPGDHFFQYSVAFLWLMGFASSTHDIAIDGFYMMGLTQYHQAYFAGVRNVFYRFAMLSGQGLFVLLAGQLEIFTDDIPLAWSLTFFVLAGIMLLSFFWHQYILPKPDTDVPKKSQAQYSPLQEAWNSIQSFFQKEGIIWILLFILLFRLSESQLLKLIPPFLLDNREIGGMEITTSTLGQYYGTAGLVMMIGGALLGGYMCAKWGLKKCFPIMLITMNLPAVLYVILSYFLPQTQYLVAVVIGLEQGSLGIAFSIFTVYLIYASKGPHQTSHFAIATSFMAWGIIIPGMYSGAIQEWLGYQQFFLYTLACALPGILIAFFLKIDPDFGKKGTNHGFKEKLIEN